ncbi:MAG TPA: hypothetical protein VI997_07890 [Candidatus Thermoplasmatota archaeon]|nr:hypothetical protein [Candidatus Thermoplasmatota archaeon]
MTTVAEVGDQGSLMLLSGFILGLALVITGITLSEVAELEKEAVREQDSSFTSEYRSVREKLGNALDDTVTTTTDTTSFTDNYENIVSSFDELENARGFQFVSVLAGGEVPSLCAEANMLAARSECYTWTVLDAGCAVTGRSYIDTGDVVLDGECYDGGDDGIVLVGTVVKGAFVFLHLDDPTTQIEEVQLYPLNR